MKGHITLVRSGTSKCEIQRCQYFFCEPYIQFEEEVTFLLHYPRDQSLRLLSSANVDVVFIPRTEGSISSIFRPYVIPSDSLWALQPTRHCWRSQLLIQPRGCYDNYKLFQLVRPGR